MKREVDGQDGECISQEVFQEGEARGGLAIAVETKQQPGAFAPAVIADAGLPECETAVRHIMG